MDPLFLLQNVKGCFRASHTRYIRLKLKAVHWPASYSQMSQSVHLTPCQIAPPLTGNSTPLSKNKNKFEMLHSTFSLFLSLYK